jgi:hypothetical protein
VEIEATRGGVRLAVLLKARQDYLKKLNTLDPPAAQPEAFWNSIVNEHIQSFLPPSKERPLRLPLWRPRRELMDRAKQLQRYTTALTQDDLALLVEELERADLKPATILIAKSAQLRLRFFDAGEEDYAQAGSTRFGGDPDLPTQWTWPKSSARDLDRTEAVFIAQFNLSQLPKLPDNPLPRRGVMYVFLTQWDDGTPPGFELLHYTGPLSKLKRRPSPPENRIASEYLHALRARKTTCGIRLDIPLADQSFREAIASKCASERDIDEWELIDCLGSLGRPPEERGCLGQWLGFANTPDYQTDLYESVVLSQKGKSGCQYYSSLETFDRRKPAKLGKMTPAEKSKHAQERADVQWYLENQPAIRRAAKAWRLLFNLRSNEAMNLELGDAGSMYCFIRKSDLVKANFSRISSQFEQS